MSDSPTRPLTETELAAYDRDGVICARGLFPSAWVERMAAAVDAVVANPTMYGTLVSMPEQGFSGDLFLWKQIDVFRDFVYDSPAAPVAQQILRTPAVRFFYDQLFVKPAGCHVATPWHHDVTFWPVEGESVVSMWMAFDPVTRASSGLEFVRGSHRWPNRFKAVTPNYDPYMMDSDLEDVPDIDHHRDDYELLCWDLEPGDVLLFNGLIVHGSTGNYSTDRPRRAFASRWVGEGVRYAPRHATMPLLWPHGLTPGDTLSGPLFPQILPAPIAAEGARRAAGPEPPDFGLIQAARAAAGR
jgi:ectoine hydroxylase-related dioxygenase (phytanoyl-CoA dioxygenase family)